LWVTFCREHVQQEDGAYSITSSARASSAAGTVMPSASVRITLDSCRRFGVRWHSPMRRDDTKPLRVRPMAAEVSAIPAGRRGLRTIGGVELIEPLKSAEFGAVAAFMLACACRGSGGRDEIARISVSADDVAADVAAGGCGHASAVNHVHTRSASLADLCDHVVRLRKRRE